LSRAAAALALLAAGCGGYYTASAHAAAEGALDDLTSPAANVRYAQTVATVAQAARAEFLDPQTSTALTALVKDEGIVLRAEVASTVQTAGAAARAELARTLRLTVDEALDETTLQEIAALREELAGAPLRADIDAVIDSATPHLATAVAQATARAVLPVQSAADAEASKWRPIAVAFAVGCALLCACLGFAGWVLREHQRTIRELTAKR
jgi:hypothetical protein